MSEETTKPRILAVDDSKVMRKAMTKVLGQDYDVIEASDGEDAWTILTNDSEIQVVFTDLSMPYLDGFGLLQRMRDSDEARFQDMPVVIITGKDDDDETKELALNMGASDFITKPFDSVQLKARAKAHVNFDRTSKKLDETANKLEQQATIDELTGLGGRRYFWKAGEESLSYTRRHHGQFIILRLDIDDFNTIFIANGKQFADRILRQTGAVLARLVRKEDMVARIGLAKFAMLLRDTDIDSAMQLGKRLIKEVNAVDFETNGHTLNITVSIGMLEPLITDEVSFEELVAETEKYLKKAVEEGGNQVVIKSLRKDYARTKVDIGTALRLIEEGETACLEPHRLLLARQIFPLLNFLAEDPASGLHESIEQLKLALGHYEEKLAQEQMPKKEAG
ncbi:MAG TPA: diguanylate cyclase [Gammaproteobacteria bacterium]|nr:diguanylate cyclase [Gammaproteobacteria bacterium]